MNFRIADSSTDILAKLTREEQKAVKTTAFDLQLDPAQSPECNFINAIKQRTSIWINQAQRMAPDFSYLPRLKFDQRKAKYGY